MDLRCCSLRTIIEIQALAANRSDDPLRIRVLPGRLGGSDDLPDAQARDSAAKPRTVDGVRVAEQKSQLSSVAGECFDDLLRGPLGGWVGGHVDVQDTPTVMGENEEAVQQTERDSRNDEEVAGRCGAKVVTQEGKPAFFWGGSMKYAGEKA
jgi:hypothetical protein